MSIGRITSPNIYIEPSSEFAEFLHNIHLRVHLGVPENIKKFYLKNYVKETDTNQQQRHAHKYLLTTTDYEFLKSLSSENLEDDCRNKVPFEFSNESESTTIDSYKLLTLSDLHWLFNYIQELNTNRSNLNSPKLYLHTFLKGSKIVLPSNAKVPRNEKLEARCKQLKINQENTDYHNMTRFINGRMHSPDNSVAYQMKVLNRQLIAIFQFIVSVLAGFAFGFIGIELLVGTLDFGFRLLLGIMCGLIIALAELYFLAKRLNEDIVDMSPTKSPQSAFKNGKYD